MDGHQELKRGTEIRDVRTLSWHLAAVVPAERSKGKMSADRIFDMSLVLTITNSEHTSLTQVNILKLKQKQTHWCLTLEPFQSGGYEAGIKYGSAWQCYFQSSAGVRLRSMTAGPELAKRYDSVSDLHFGEKGKKRSPFPQNIHMVHINSNEWVW